MPALAGSPPVSPTGAPPPGHAAHTPVQQLNSRDRAGGEPSPACRQQGCLWSVCRRLRPPRCDRSRPSGLHAIQAQAHEVFSCTQSGGGAGAAAGQHPCTHSSGRTAQPNKQHTLPPATAQRRSQRHCARGALWRAWRAMGRGRPPPGRSQSPQPAPSRRGVPSKPRLAKPPSSTTACHAGPPTSMPDTDADREQHTHTWTQHSGARVCGSHSQSAGMASRRLS